MRASEIQTDANINEKGNLIITINNRENDHLQDAKPRGICIR